MAALGGLLIAVGLVIAIPRGMFPGSSSNRNVEMGGRLFRTPGYQGVGPSRRGKIIDALMGLGLMGLGALLIELWG
jgi:hypothetical protein